METTRVRPPHFTDEQPATLIELGRLRAASQPDRVVHTFLRDGEREDASLTFGQLDQRARAIAAVLQQGSAVGERALLLQPPGLDFIAAFMGCLYAGLIAVPAYTPGRGNLKRTLPRLLSIAASARPSVVLTSREIEQFLRPRAPELPVSRWCATDVLPAGAESAWVPPAVSGESLAFLQYTSGSTSAPKGVRVSHRNLLHNLEAIHAGFGHTEDSVAVTWLPAFHDMGLIDGILQPLYGGFVSHGMAPLAFLQHPLRWLQALSRYRATHSGGPNFAYDLCVSRIPSEQRATLDLSSWRVAYNGAEPVRRETLERFADAFAVAGFRRGAFYPCYGLAEATLKVSGGQASTGPVYARVRAAALERHEVVDAAEAGDDSRWLVGCGTPPADLTVVAVDPETRRPCGPERVGELWVRGPSVAQGYWNEPEETAHAFQARLAGEPEADPFLRTGDLGFLRDQTVFVTGRLKDLIILHGRNHYPQDIEETVERSHPSVRQGACAAFPVDVDGEERLFVAAELDRHAPGVRASTTPDAEERLDDIVRAVRKAVADAHEVQVHQVLLLRPGTLPKTSSGKLQRRACRQGFLSGSLSTLQAGPELKSPGHD